ncbi:MAG: PD-(D/E)XK nuclease-like domain-containing protein, partial [Methylophilaceae bacterium]|nr:PD-(D/E)XK nuclease-like domain-containing protein [Methylophilaceae bacterium]
ISPDKGRSAADKLAFASYLAANPDKVLISRSEMDMIEAVQESVAKHCLASKILRMGQAETSIFWHDPDTGIRCKCRPDLLVSPWLILDVKTTEDASEEAFMRSCANYRYDLSAAMYREGVLQATQKSLDFVFLAIEKKPPFAVALYRANERFLAHGERLLRRSLAILKYCRETGDYPGYQPDGVVSDIDLPRWYQ